VISQEIVGLLNLDRWDGEDTITEIKMQGGFSMADTFEDVKEIIVDLLNVDESKVTPEARFREDLEADSLDLVELIMAFEDKFGGEISDEDAQQISTVGEVVKYINDHMVS
jgi:acyl carrier protein